MGIKQLLSDFGAYGRAYSSYAADRNADAGPGVTDEPGRQRKLVEALHPSRMRLRVTERIDETETTRTLRFERIDGELPPFRPGQYVNLFVELGGVRTSRPYSISSAPGVGHLDLTVREIDGGFVSRYLAGDVHVGDVLETTGPAGRFYHEPLVHGDQLVFLAGGSGITPFMSLIRDAARCDWPLDITLLYGSRIPDDIIFVRELRRLARGNKKLTFVPVISEPPKGYRGKRGFLDAGCITKCVPELQGRTFYMCGPIPMLELCRSSLLELGVPSHRIRQELYGPPSDVTLLDGWPQGVDWQSVFTVQVGDRSFQASAAEPLINSLERNGVVVPSVCRSGECSACRTRLLRGEVFSPPFHGLRISDRRYGYIHPCMCYPVSDLELRI